MTPAYRQIVALGRVLRKHGFKRAYGDVILGGGGDGISLYHKITPERRLSVQLVRGGRHSVGLSVPTNENGPLWSPRDRIHFDTGVEMLAAIAKLTACEPGEPELSRTFGEYWSSSKRFVRRPAARRNRPTNEDWYGKPPK